MGTGSVTVELGGDEKEVSRCINCDGVGSLTCTTCRGTGIQPHYLDRSNESLNLCFLFFLANKGLADKQEKMLYIIGLGLGDEKDITLRGLEAVQKCEKVYMEAYTSLLSFGLSIDGLSTLENLYGKPIAIADREMVEEKADDILSSARTSDVAFLVVGDPFGATTHTDLVVRAKELGVDVKVVHNASVMNAVGICGLQLYRYGETVSIPFFTDNWRPDSFYEKIRRNRELGLHTLCVGGRKKYEPPRYMTIDNAIDQLLEIEQKCGESGETCKCFAIFRLSCCNIFYLYIQASVYGTLELN
ncbi:hypothetical protein GH714_016261 [Hevea brasiliensis]|uniref:diphthine methyl ester synthase n=1 Tax=Hevea brasiliensis TaxID=3981 RepID=A0A6A6NHQ3_HEVBR|nr:hypothetical protein GH714_016261 [Hevea brasiliensis]